MPPRVCRRRRVTRTAQSSASSQSVKEKPNMARNTAAANKEESQKTYPVCASDLVLWQFHKRDCSRKIKHFKEHIFLKHPTMHLNTLARSTHAQLVKRNSRALAKMYFRNTRYMYGVLETHTASLVPKLRALCACKEHKRINLERQLVRNELVMSQIESENADIRTILCQRKTLYLI